MTPLSSFLLSLYTVAKVRPLNTTTAVAPVSPRSNSLPPSPVCFGGPESCSTATVNTHARSLLPSCATRWAQFYAQAVACSPTPYQSTPPSRSFGANSPRSTSQPHETSPQQQQLHSAAGRDTHPPSPLLRPPELLDPQSQKSEDVCRVRPKPDELKKKRGQYVAHACPA